MARNEYHVVSHQNGWAVKANNATRASKITNTKQEAIEFGRELSKKNEAELIVHKKDGTINKSTSYGNDPCPPKDRT